MKLIKFGHSCVRLEKNGHAIVIDPGVFSDVKTALDGADAILVTHEHADHIDADAVRTAMGENAELRVWAPASVAATLADELPDAMRGRVTTAEPESGFTAAGFDVRTFGGQHAVIHLLLPVVSNVCYLIDGAVYHPGDSFTVPSEPVQAVLIPIHAPWSKVSEVIDFAIAVRAPQAFQIHDGLLNDTGRGMVEGLTTRLSAPFGTTFRHLDVGESVELG
jgi:L-ascorbate metabolism protein UlaG (beta-lactamase superfamily)